MNKLRHIAIASKNPEKDAKFFVEVLGMTVKDKGVGDNPNYYLTDDGTIELALINLTDHDIMGRERPLDYEGLHHIGFEVDNLEEAEKNMATAKVPRRDDINNAIHARNEARAKAGTAVNKRRGGVEVKYWGPSGITFDLMQKKSAK